MKPHRIISIIVTMAAITLADPALAKGKGKKAPSTPPTPEQVAAQIETNFVHMNPNSEGLVTLGGVIEFKKWQNPNRQYYSVERAEQEGKAIYDTCLALMTGDKSKGFNLVAYKAYKNVPAKTESSD